MQCRDHSLSDGLISATERASVEPADPSHCTHRSSVRARLGPPGQRPRLAPRIRRVSARLSRAPRAAGCMAVTVTLLGWAVYLYITALEVNVLNCRVPRVCVGQPGWRPVMVPPGGPARARYRRGVVRRAAGTGR